MPLFSIFPQQLMYAVYEKLDWFVRNRVDKFDKFIEEKHNTGLKEA